MNLADGLELGYLGVDFVLGRRRRPGGAGSQRPAGPDIQVANRRGLLPRCGYRRPAARAAAAENRLDLLAAVAEMA